MLHCRIHVLATFRVSLATLSVITYAYTSRTPNDGSPPAQMLLPDATPLIVYSNDRTMLARDKVRALLARFVNPVI